MSENPDDLAAERQLFPIALDAVVECEQTEWRRDATNDARAARG